MKDIVTNLEDGHHLKLGKMVGDYKNRPHPADMINGLKIPHDTELTHDDQHIILLHAGYLGDDTIHKKVWGKDYDEKQEVPTTKIGPFLRNAQIAIRKHGREAMREEASKRADGANTVMFQHRKDPHRRMVLHRAVRKDRGDNEWQLSKVDKKLGPTGHTNHPTFKDGLHAGVGVSQHQGGYWNEHGYDIAWTDKDGTKAPFSASNDLIQRFSAAYIARYGQMMFDWNEDDHPRETKFHTDDHGDKRPGEFAPKPNYHPTATPYDHPTEPGFWEKTPSGLIRPVKTDVDHQREEQRRDKSEKWNSQKPHEIVIIGCGKQKQEGTHAAEDLYRSTYFNLNKGYAKSKADDWFIISGLHGLLEPTEQTESYNYRLKKYEREQWAKKTAKMLMDKMSHVDKPINLEITAGKDYADALQQQLRQWPHVTVTQPMAGMGIMERQSWLKKNTASDQTQVNKQVADGFQQMRRAKAGGEISEVDGKTYKGGQIMPVHGKFSGMEKPKTKKKKKEPTGQGLPVAKEDSDFVQKSEEEKAAYRKERDERAKNERKAAKRWDLIRSGPIGEMQWYSDKPFAKWGRNIKAKWRPWAEKIGPETLQKVIDRVKPKAIEAELKASRNKSGNPAHNDAEAYQEQMQQYIDGDKEFGAGLWPKKHQKAVPNSVEAFHWVEEFLSHHDPWELHKIVSGITTVQDAQKLADEYQDPLGDAFENAANKFTASQPMIQRFAAAWEESKHPREKTFHDTKRPGEFAPLTQRGMFGEDYEAAPYDPKEHADLTGKAWHQDVSTSPAGDKASKLDDIRQAKSKGGMVDGSSFREADPTSDGFAETYTSHPDFFPVPEERHPDSKLFAYRKTKEMMQLERQLHAETLRQYEEYQKNPGLIYRPKPEFDEKKFAKRTNDFYERTAIAHDVLSEIQERPELLAKFEQAHREATGEPPKTISDMVMTVEFEHQLVFLPLNAAMAWANGKKWGNLVGVAPVDNHSYDNEGLRSGRMDKASNPIAQKQLTRNELKLLLGNEIVKRALQTSWGKGRAFKQLAEIHPEQMNQQQKMQWKKANHDFESSITPKEKQKLDSIGITPRELWQAVRKGNVDLVKRLARKDSRRKAMRNAGRKVLPDDHPFTTDPRGNKLLFSVDPLTQRFTAAMDLQREVMQFNIPRPGTRAASNRAIAPIPSDPKEGIPVRPTQKPQAKLPTGPRPSRPAPPQPSKTAGTKFAKVGELGPWQGLKGPFAKARASKMGQPAKTTPKQPRAPKQPQTTQVARPKVVGPTFREDMQTAKEGIKSLAGLPRQMMKDAGFQPKDKPAKQPEPDKKRQVKWPKQAQQPGQPPATATPSVANRADDLDDKEFRRRTGKSKAQWENAMFRRQQQLANLQRTKSEKGRRFREQAKQLGIAGMRGMVKRGGLLDTGLRAWANSSRMNDRDRSINSEMDWREQQLRAEMEHNQRMLQREPQESEQQEGQQAPQSPEPNKRHGYTDDEVKMFQNLGMDEDAMAELWSQKHDPNRAFDKVTERSNDKTNEPLTPQTPQKAGQNAETAAQPNGAFDKVTEQSNEVNPNAKRRRLPLGQGEQLPDLGFASSDKLDDTGLGFDPQLSQHDNRHDYLLPKQAQDYQRKAEQAWNKYQSTGDENQALKAAAMYRQLKLHGYNDDMPHSVQGLRELHETNQKRHEDVSLARQWQDLSIRLRDNPDDKFSSNAKRIIEKRFADQGIDIRKEVLSAIARGKRDAIAGELQEYQNAYRAAPEWARKGKRANPGEFVPSEELAAADKLRDIRRSFADRNIDLGEMLREKTREYLERHPQKKELYKKRWADRQAADKARQNAPDNEKPTKVPDNVPAMDSPASFDEIEAQEAEDLRNQLVNKQREEEQEQRRQRFEQEQAEKLAAIQSSKLTPEQEQEQKQQLAQEEEEFWDQMETGSAFDPLTQWKHEKVPKANKNSDPTGYYIQQQVGQDYIMNKVLRDWVDNAKEMSNKENSRVALVHIAENILGRRGSQNWNNFMGRLKRADGPAARVLDKNGEMTNKLLLPEIDKIASSAMHSEDDTVAQLLGKKKMDKEGVQDIIFNELQELAGRTMLTAEQWVKEAIRVNGGQRQLDKIHAEYYGSPDDDAEQAIDEPNEIEQSSQQESDNDNPYEVYAEGDPEGYDRMKRDQEMENWDDETLFQIASDSRDSADRDMARFLLDDRGVHNKDDWPDDDETVDEVPFTSNGSVMRFATTWAIEETKRELGLSYNVDIVERYSIRPIQPVAADPLIQRFQAHWQLNTELNRYAHSN
jgi:hypothetical protein